MCETAVSQFCRESGEPRIAALVFYNAGNPTGSAGAGGGATF
jgi:hypothetical protein